MQSIVEYARSSRGQKLRRFVSFWVAVFLVSLVSALAVASDRPVLAQSSLNNFTIEDYKIEYELGINEDKRSTLTTTETITANFPNRDENRGILREIPHEYDDHKVRLKIESVTDAEGKSIEYETETSGDMTTVRIGDPDEYVNGRQVYQIKYTQQDVTKSYESSTGNDEFYWDTNGTGWRVPIDRLSVTLKIDESLRDRLTGETACYIGSEGSGDSCTLEETGQGYSVRTESLDRGENVTIAVGFELGTFAEFEPTLWDKYVEFMQGTWVIIGVIGGALLVAFSFYWNKLHNRKDEVGTIVNQFLPPKDMSVSAASMLYSRPQTQYTAQLLDLAVRGYIQIIETKPKKSWMSPAKHDIEIKKESSDLLAEEREVIVDLFHSESLAVGTRINLQKVSKSAEYAKKRADDTTNLLNAFNQHYVYREKKPELSRKFYITGSVVLVIALVTLNFVAGIIGVIILILGATLRPYTEKGLEALRYLKGLERYMKVAEADRIKYLHSPEGVNRVPKDVNVDEPEQLLKLNERLLPYAVVFGIEKKWIEELAVSYKATDNQPGWYSGPGNYASSAALIGALNGFNTSATYASASSSSTGGSTGGGYSGGGGGGGGGGGW